MKSNSTITVLTTINQPHHRIQDWYDITKNKVIVIGDNKTPQDWYHPKCDFYPITEQQNCKFKLGRELPKNHYTRKNIGYLYAILNGANIIIDTDDDNFPYTDQWNLLLSNDFKTVSLKDSKKRCFKNIYTYFSNCNIPFWPRGFPLDHLHDPSAKINKNGVSDFLNNSDIALWQCMVDGDPDIDAIHRLIFETTPQFSTNEALVFGNNLFCPLNSQNTLWRKKEFFPLLYLPSTVSFRFTDILRGYVAQAIIHSLDSKWGFYPPTALQKRNDHNLMKDFTSEIIMYENTSRIVEIIMDKTSPNLSIIDNLYECYRALEKKKFVQTKELLLLDFWLNDLNSI